MKHFLAVTTGLLSLVGGVASTASAQEPKHQGYVVVDPGVDPNGYYDARGGPVPYARDGYYDGARGYRAVPGYPAHPGYSGYAHDPVTAARALAESAEHLAEVARSVSFDPRLVNDAFAFAGEAAHFEQLVARARDPRVIERDFLALAREYQALHTNFGRRGFTRHGRHVEEDFDQVRLAFRATAEALRASYARPYPARYGRAPARYYRGGAVPGRGYQVRFQIGF